MAMTSILGKGVFMPVFRRFLRVSLSWIWLAVGVNAALSQNLSVKTGKNQMDDETWVRLELKADRPYQSKGGVVVLPLIEIQCSSSPKAASIDVFFLTGVINTDSAVRIKVGELAPFRLLYSVLPDMETLQYIDLQDAHGSFGYVKKADFAAVIANSKTVLIEFSPYLFSSYATAEFDTTSLMPELAKHPECTSQITKK